MVTKDDKWTFRLPTSLKRQVKSLQEKYKDFNGSAICRDALSKAANEREIFGEIGSPIRSKKQSNKLFTRLKDYFVRTNLELDWEKISKSSSKLYMFRHLFQEKCPPELLADLGDFIQGREYSEEILGIYCDANGFSDTIEERDEK